MPSRRRGIFLALLSVPFSGLLFASPPLCTLVLPDNSREPARGSRDLQQGVITGVDRDGQSLAVLAQVKVGTSGRWVHALVSDADNGLATSDGIANGTMTVQIVVDVEGEGISVQGTATVATIVDASGFGDPDKSVARVLFFNDALVACLASIIVWALEALEAIADDAVEAEVASGVMDGTRHALCSGGNFGCDRCVILIAHGTNVDHNLARSVERNKLVISKGTLVLSDLVYHAGVAIVKVWAIEALVANTDNGIGLAAVASNTHVLDGRSRLIG
jgi:hypothetical protein